MNDHEVYARFIKIMFEEFDQEELAYAHVVQQQAIQDQEDMAETWVDYGDWEGQ